MPDFTRSLFSFGFAGKQHSHTAPEYSRESTTPTPTPKSDNYAHSIERQSTPYLPPKTAPVSAVSSASAHGGLSRPTEISLPAQATTPPSINNTTATTNTEVSDLAGNENQGLVTPPLIETTEVIGKLKVRIIEARNLTTPELATPYIVCTFDSSEFVGHGAAGPIDSGTGLGVIEGPNTICASSGEQSRARPTGGIAIPKSRQSSSLALATLGTLAARHGASNPLWKDEAKFDVTSHESILDISIYDSLHGDAFLGHTRIQPDVTKQTVVDTWLPLQPRVRGERVTGEVRVQYVFEPFAKARAIGPEDFEVLRLVGKGTFGKVYQVRKKDTHRVYAMKVLSKKVIVQKKEVAHTIGERNILVRTSSAQSAFIVNLKFSFQTVSDLYLVTDYMSGGELFWHLQREGKFSEERAKFYIAELIVALDHLHNNGIVYRDLKPENILLDVNGHIALCDFGLSKANLRDDGTTSTFCGTTEYLAPEVLLDDQGYTKMVDFWSLGVLVFEMCCGWSPFYAEDNQQMYKNIAFGKVRFPRDALSVEGRNFVKGLLNRNPRHRLGAEGDAKELMNHPFFRDVDWDALAAKKLPPPFKPQVASETDTSNFDPEFTQASTSAVHRALLHGESTPLSPGIQAKFQGFTYVDSTLEDNFKKFGSSVRPGAIDEDIEWYDDNTNDQRLGHEPHIGEEEEDVQMRDDGDEHDFVNGQGFEM